MEMKIPVPNKRAFTPEVPVPDSKLGDSVSYGAKNLPITTEEIDKFGLTKSDWEAAREDRRREKILGIVPIPFKSNKFWEYSDL